MCHEPVSDGSKTQIQYYFQYIHHLKWHVALKIHRLWALLQPVSLRRLAKTAGAGNVNNLSCDTALKIELVVMWYYSS